MAVDYQIPDRNFAKQVRTVMTWALIPIILVAVPLTWVLLVSLDTSDNTQDIRTAQNQADRNLAVQSCTSEYAATYSAWDAEADRLFGMIVDDAFADRLPSRTLLRDFIAAGENEAEMNRRRLGLSILARSEVTDRTDGFVCPAIPDRLEVEPLDPTNPDPPE